MSPHASHDHSSHDKVLHSARGYDAVVWVLTLGKERQFRADLLELARLDPGESVLDVGCGTGSLALAAKARVGPDADVAGVDPSPEMVARARRKAAKAGLAVRFETGSVEALPLPDRTFDVALATLMLHHLSEENRQKGVAEIARVLRPGGRFLAVDLGGGQEAAGHRRRRGLLHRCGGARHAGFALAAMTPVLEAAGLRVVEEAPLGGRRVIGLSDLRFVLAAAS